MGAPYFLVKGIHPYILGHTAVSAVPISWWAHPLYRVLTFQSPLFKLKEQSSICRKLKGTRLQNQWSYMQDSPFGVEVQNRVHKMHEKRGSFKSLRNSILYCNILSFAFLLVFGKTSFLRPGSGYSITLKSELSLLQYVVVVVTILQSLFKACKQASNKFGACMSNFHLDE